MFEAATHYTQKRENGQKKAVHLLLAHVNRDLVDSEAVRDILKTVESLMEALDGISMVLDAPMDTFTAMQEVSRFHWQPGLYIDEYLFALKRKAVYAKLGLRHVASWEEICLTSLTIECG